MVILKKPVSKDLEVRVLPNGHIESAGRWRNGKRAGMIAERHHLFIFVAYD